MSIDRIIAEGLDGFEQFFEQHPVRATQAAVMAINQSARDSLPLAKRLITEQVNFPRGYLNTDRFSITKRATSNSLEAHVSARTRPTSLARFVEGSPSAKSIRKNGLKIMIKPGRVVDLKKAFLVRLRAGDGSGPNSNVGLAVRLKPGQSLDNTRGAVKLAANLWLLYGPSVDQVFRTVAGDMAPEVLDNLATEWQRQYTRLMG